IAVNALGYNHPVFTKKMCDHLQQGVLHTSNIYYVETQAKLAEKLTKLTCADRVYFANSGAEANECAIKLAKIYQYKKGNSEKYKIITLNRSFHGRTLTTVAATGQPKYQAPYKPLTPGFIHAELNDFSALESLVDNSVCAIMLEPIQGESGVHLADKDYLQKIRSLCDEKDILLIFDEVQTGVGRTGALYAYQKYGIEPDIFTTAKALGNGFPISACCAKEFVASAFSPGDHGGTYGGNGFACCAGLTVLECIEQENLLDNAKNVGNYLMDELKKIDSPHILEVRGMGLMIGIETDQTKLYQQKLFENGILVGTAGGTALRLVPPLVLTIEESAAFISVFKTIINE
ncbi:MAG: acetylornithine/succinylornithine family transaminase, partial [Ruminococcaceae bacterium]|nr:acetylornithine/succinylornithine family transaminase [Oscillospiraceae bacterium]